MALPGNPREQYLRTQIETASKEQLVVMLFDGIIRFTEVARKAIEEKKIEESHHALMRAQAIVMELICTVDKEKGGDLAKNLMGLHAYAFNCLIVCNMKKDISKIDEVQKIYRQLREGWVGAMEKLGIGPRKGSAAPASTGQIPPKPAGPAPAAKTPVTFTPKPGQFPGKGPGGVLAQGRQPAAATAAPKPVTLGSPKPIMPAAAPKIAAPVAEPAPPVAPAAAAQAAPAPAAKAPAAPSAAAISYGMGRTAAMMGAYGKAPAPAPAAPAPAVPVAAAAAAAPAAAKPVLNPKQAAMLSAYQANSSRTSA